MVRIVINVDEVDNGRTLRRLSRASMDQKKKYKSQLFFKSNSAEKKEKYSLRRNIKKKSGNFKKKHACRYVAVSNSKRVYRNKQTKKIYQKSSDSKKTY